MKVSVIVPIYNVEQEISRCILSVLNQDYSDIELILVNDCTPDGSFEVAKKVITEQNTQMSIKYVEHKVNRGLSAARNSGIEAATGDYLFFLDSDDALSDPNVMSKLVRLSLQDSVHNQHYEVIIGNYQEIKGQNIHVGMQQDYRLNSHFDVFKAYAEGRLSITACWRLISRELVLTHGLRFKEGIYHEDELWSFYLFQKASSVRATSDIIYDYFLREGSISFEIKKKNVTDLNVVIEALYQSFLHHTREQAPYEALKIEALKRRSLKWLSRFDPLFMKQELLRLSQIKTGFKSRRLRFFLQNLIFKLPDSFAIWYLKKRWGKK